MVTELLEMSQLVDQYGMSEVQIRRCRIKPALIRSGLPRSSRVINSCSWMISSVPRFSNVMASFILLISMPFRHEMPWSK